MRRLALAAALAASCSTAAPSTVPTQQGATAPGGGSYQTLLGLFSEWRQFQKPKLQDGVPDYSPRAMDEQRRALAGFQQRLDAIDPRGWPVAQQVDWHVVRAEMNGLDFDHRVLQPWAKNPAFYVTVFNEQSDQPAREGPFALGSVELWKEKFPLSAERAAALATALAPIPKLLEQARTNLTGNARDLWVYGIRSVKEQRTILATLAGQVGPHAQLGVAVQRAIGATDGYVQWLEQQAPSKTGPSGIGVANYDWYLQNVQLLPYTWADEVELCERELARARATLALEEQRNRGLPEQQPISSAEEHARRMNAGVTEYLQFLREHDLHEIEPWMDEALRSRIGSYSDKRPLEFFTESDWRDPVLMRTHGYHWFDLGWMQQHPHESPVRRDALLYNIFDSRTEGFATANEELLMHAGLVDARPRSRELVWVLLAQRAARALGDLRMHSNELTLEQAAKFASANTPRGWLRLEKDTVWAEQHLYLQQPSYGTSYVIGKLEVDRLIATRAQQLGAGFTLKRFYRELDGVGLLPISLVRWELTGETDRVPGLGWKPR